MEKLLCMFFLVAGIMAQFKDLETLPSFIPNGEWSEYMPNKNQMNKNRQNTKSPLTTSPHLSGITPTSNPNAQVFPKPTVDNKKPSSLPTSTPARLTNSTPLRSASPVNSLGVNQAYASPGLKSRPLSPHPNNQVKDVHMQTVTPSRPSSPPTNMPSEFNVSQPVFGQFPVNEFPRTSAQSVIKHVSFQPLSPEIAHKISSDQIPKKKSSKTSRRNSLPSQASQPSLTPATRRASTSSIPTQELSTFPKPTKLSDAITNKIAKMPVTQLAPFPSPAPRKIPSPIPQGAGGAGSPPPPPPHPPLVSLPPKNPKGTGLSKKELFMKKMKGILLSAKQLPSKISKLSLFSKLFGKNKRPLLKSATNENAKPTIYNMGKDGDNNTQQAEEQPLSNKSSPTNNKANPSEYSSSCTNSDNEDNEITLAIATSRDGFGDVDDEDKEAENRKSAMIVFFLALIALAFILIAIIYDRCKASAQKSFEADEKIISKGKNLADKNEYYESVDSGVEENHGDDSIAIDGSFEDEANNIFLKDKEGGDRVGKEQPPDSTDKTPQPTENTPKSQTHVTNPRKYANDTNNLSKLIKIHEDALEEFYRQSPTPTRR